MASQQAQSLKHSSCEAACVALVRPALLVLGQAAAAGDAHPVRGPVRGGRGILGRSLGEARRHVAVVEGVNVAVVRVRWTDDIARRRLVVTLGESRFRRRLEDPAVVVAGAVVVVMDSPRSWDSDFR